MTTVARAGGRPRVRVDGAAVALEDVERPGRRKADADVLEDVERGLVDALDVVARQDVPVKSGGDGIDPWAHGRRPRGFERRQAERRWPNGAAGAAAAPTGRATKSRQPERRRRSRSSAPGAQRSHARLSVRRRSPLTALEAGRAADRDDAGRGHATESIKRPIGGNRRARPGAAGEAWRARVTAATAGPRRAPRSPRARRRDRPAAGRGDDRRGCAAAIAAASSSAPRRPPASQAS